MASSTLWSFIRFRVLDERGFRELADPVVAHWRACVGCESVSLIACVDDPELWAIASVWSDVGSYRRSFFGYEAKLVLSPLMSLALDEPSAYLPPGAR